jgi:hypothetical protein
VAEAGGVNGARLSPLCPEPRASAQQPPIPWTPYGRDFAASEEFLRIVVAADGAADDTRGSGPVAAGFCEAGEHSEAHFERKVGGVDATE